MVDSLMQLSQAVKWLAEASTLDDVKKIHDLAIAAQAYAKAHKLGIDAQNSAAAIIIEAAAKAGELLRQMPKAEAGRPPENRLQGETDFDRGAPTYAELGIEKTQAHRWQKIASIPEEERLDYVSSANEEGQPATVSGLLARIEKAHVSFNSGENEWYTPPEYIQAARETMGSIDVDPASCEKANSIVNAGKFYTADDNGLEKNWEGNVWLNPPYSQPLISQFSQAVTEKYLCGEIHQACILVNNATETTWFQMMMSTASAICFPKGRVKFIDKNGNPAGAPLQGQAIIYMGNYPKLFSNAFSKFGVILHG